MKRLGSALVLPALLWAGLSLLTPSPGFTAQAQQRGAAQRVVQGKVQDKAGAPVKGATVFLKDGHTLAVKSFLSTDDGSYHIGQLSPNADYEVWAELDGKKSATHPISSFDTKNDITLNLKLDK